MATDPLEAQQRAWAEETLCLLRELLPLMTPVGRYQYGEMEHAHTIGALASACARSSESVVLLCAYGQLWDAEVVSRSVCEGTLKFMYLLQAVNTFQQRHDEYAMDLFYIGLLKDHKKAEELLAAVPDSDARYWKPIQERLLSPDELLDIESRFDKQARRSLDTKWGFSGLIGQLTRSGDPAFSNISCFSHGYSMSSHLMHADSIGTSIALERDLRSSERRQKLHLSHLVGLLSSQVEYLYMRLMIGYRFTGNPLDDLVGAEVKIRALKDKFGTAYEDWLNCEYKDKR